MNTIVTYIFIEKNAMYSMCIYIYARVYLLRIYTCNSSSSMHICIDTHVPMTRTCYITLYVV